MNLKNVVSKPHHWEDYFSKLREINDRGEQEIAGKLFEEFCFYFFQCDPVRKGLYKAIYRDRDIPPSIKSKLSLADIDHGVDLLLVDKNDQYIAVQCKFKSDETSILSWSKDRLANALAEARHADGLIIMTNSSGVDGHTARRGISDFKSFNLISYSHLAGLSGEAIRNIWHRSRNEKSEKKIYIEPRDYQQEAILKVVRKFRTFNRGQLILPCGAGKTLTSLWIKEKLKPRITLVMVPSLALLRQTMEEWSKHQKSWANFICVCSEKGIDSAVEIDSPVAHSYEIPSVTTNPSELRKFLKQAGPKIIYATYQSANVIRDAVKGTSIKIDLALCDEAHKTAGDRKSKFALIHDNRAVPIKRRLYMTATPRIVAENVKTKLGEDVKYLADMGDQTTFGIEFYRMTFGQAIRKKILCDYKIIAIGVSDEELRTKLSNYISPGKTLSDVANNYALGKVMTKYKASHAISFHSSIKRARKFSDAHRDIFRDIKAALVTGEQPTNLRKKLLDEFKEQPKAVLSNARCLTEGIDVPAIDCVYFCDPRNSKVDIVQASGRALRQARDKGKTFGYIVVPIYHRDKSNVEAAIDTSIFKNLVSVVRALADQDQRLIDEINKIKTGDPIAARKSRIEICLGVSSLSRDLNVNLLEKNLFDQVIEKSYSRWDSMLLLLKQFKEKYGHANPDLANSIQWQSLREWSHEIRLKKSRGDLQRNRENELNALGFVWHIKGVTLSDTKGLLNETEFMKFSNLTMVPSYRRRGLIKPVGRAFSGKLSFFYRPEQAAELKKKLGITLVDTTGLISENEFREKFGFTQIHRYRKRGLIKPAGNALGKNGINVFYRPKQAEELKKKLGITLDNTKGLMDETAFMEYTGLSNLARYRKRGLIRPVGKAMNRVGLSYYYNPTQAKELREKLGITLTDTKGLLNELQFSEYAGLTGIARYRKAGLIKPVGRAISGGSSNYTYFYQAKQSNELKKKLGITLTRTKGLLSETQFVKYSGITQVQKYRKIGMIKPVGRAIKNSGLVFMYRASQANELRKKIGITLNSTKGLISETRVKKINGLANISKYRKLGLISSPGRAINGTQLSYFYRPADIRKLKKRLKLK